MLAHLGPYSNPQSGSTWQHGTITAGSWLEDDADVVYNYNQVIPIIDFWYSLKSITHFWQADYGDDNESIFTVGGSDVFAPLPGSYPNAYTKIRKYAYGGYILYFESTPYLRVTKINGDVLQLIPNTPNDIALCYQSLTDLYKNNRLNTTLIGSYKMFNETTNSYEYYDGEVYISSDFKDKLVWEILGRMAHLVQDMSVPAHAHTDAHGIVSDQYEDWVYENTRYHYWNHQNIGGSFLNVNEYTNPLHFLMYTTQQIADHFGSTGPFYSGEGNDYIGGDFSTEEVAFLNSINLSSLGAPTYQSANFSTVELTNIRDKTFPHVIRATASLLYWFANEAGIIPQKCYLTFTNNFSGISETFYIKVEGTTVSAPTAPYEVLEGYTIQVEAGQNRVYNNVFYEFSHWNDGDTNASRTITASQTGTITAYYDAINPPTTPQGLTVSESTDEHPVLQWTASTGSDIIYDI